MRLGKIFAFFFCSATLIGTSQLSARPSEGIFVGPIIVSTVIDSTVEKVWDLLIDFKNYENWNKWYKIEGEAKVNAYIKALDIDSGRHLDLQISSMEKNHSICWIDVTWFTWFGVGGWRCREIEALPDGKVKLTNHFGYSGIFQIPFKAYTRQLLVDGMTLENRNIKEYLEGSKKP